MKPHIPVFVFLLAMHVSCARSAIGIGGAPDAGADTAYLDAVLKHGKSGDTSNIIRPSKSEVSASFGTVIFS